MLFRSQEIRKVYAEEIAAEGMELLGWRDVPVDPSTLGATGNQRQENPFGQVIGHAGQGRDRLGQDRSQDLAGRLPLTGKNERSNTGQPVLPLLWLLVEGGEETCRGPSRAAAAISVRQHEGLHRELSILRRVNRDGEGEYRINGAKCRLIDVIEVLADTGLGKEMHSVLSQGKVDHVVGSKPKDRRLLIEEAAGLGKHRKRRRRAQLKLDRTQENLDRALDVEREALAIETRPARSWHRGSPGGQGALGQTAGPAAEYCSRKYASRASAARLSTRVLERTV